MKKIFKWIAIGVGALLILLVAGLAFIVQSSSREHQQLIQEEKAAYPPPGVLVDINDDGRQQHVYSEGEGEVTLVFLSGWGTCCPVFDFQALYSRLSDDYRITVVERPGYGWSDITSDPRDIDTLLDETRTALQLAGESPPYVLFPHSMAGLEAIYWSMLYPDEVLAIVGLDAVTPDFAAQSEPPSFSPVITFLSRTGMMRYGPDVCQDNFPAIREGRLTADQIESACALFFRRTHTDNMQAEADTIQTNAQIVSERGMPDAPLYFFIAGRKGDAGDDDWEDQLIAYVTAVGGQHLTLDAGHYIHLFAPEQIAEESRTFIQSVTDN
ncbi:MAG: alpha/beta fold hydrolase [Anaerolineales bacterium]